MTKLQEQKLLSLIKPLVEKTMREQKLKEAIRKDKKELAMKILSQFKNKSLSQKDIENISNAIAEDGFEYKDWYSYS